jgi:hypothetical protein
VRRPNQAVDVVAALDHPADKIRADETRAAGDQDAACGPAFK